MQDQNVKFTGNSQKTSRNPDLIIASNHVTCLSHTQYLNQDFTFVHYHKPGDEPCPDFDLGIHLYKLEKLYRFVAVVVLRRTQVQSVF